MTKFQINKKLLLFIFITFLVSCDNFGKKNDFFNGDDIHNIEKYLE
tara:strand:+ start:432 stop:569 length:138 start_codon:yes stop_codon:yes gene_type:complete